MRNQLRVPRPEHTEPSPQEQSCMEKNLATVVELFKQTNPDSDVEVWAMDEQRVGLKPIILRIWVEELAVPIANVYGCMVLFIQNQGKHMLNSG